MKKLLLTVLSLLAVVSLSACSGLGVNISEGLSPPKPSGELYDIQQALEKAAGENFKLSYPSQGEYRSAIITLDLDGDEKYEVFSFYSTETDDKTTIMHINYIKWTEKGWVSVSDIEAAASGVESVDFAMLDYSGVPKVIVNWTKYSAVNKLVSVYDINSGSLKELTSAEFTVSAVTDFDKDGINEIVAVHLDTEHKTSSAQILALTENGFEPKGSCKLDGGATSYYEPVFSKLSEGTPALFIDAVKPSGTITEVIHLRDGQYVNAFVSGDAENFENVKTLRASAVRSADFNGDGAMDIPLAEKLPSQEGALESDSVYMTVWNSFDGHVFVPFARTVINFTDGYYIDVPDKWLGAFAVQRKLDMKQRTVVRWNADTNTAGEEVLKIQAVSIENWEENAANFESYVEIARSSECVFVVKFGNSALNPGEAEFKKMFHLIDRNLQNS